MLNNLKYKFWLFAPLTFVVSNLNAAYLQNVPQKIVQPNGDTIDCFATGDEFYNWLHDKEGYTIVQNPTTGFYCYAVNRDDSLIVTEYIVGIANPYLQRSINPLTSATNNCYKIPIKNTSQYLVVEYRNKTGTFENNIYGSGLVIYKINETYNDNSNGAGYGGMSDEVYVFRPNGSTNSNGNIYNA